MKLVIIIFLLINAVTAVASLRMLHKKLNPPAEPMCDRCRHLERKNKKRHNTWRYHCTERYSGFDDVPEICACYQPKDGERRESK